MTVDIARLRRLRATQAPTPQAPMYLHIAHEALPELLDAYEERDRLLDAAGDGREFVLVDRRTNERDAAIARAEAAEKEAERLREVLIDIASGINIHSGGEAMHIASAALAPR
jgi:hypothetical protein